MGGARFAGLSLAYFHCAPPPCRSLRAGLPSLARPDADSLALHLLASPAPPQRPPLSSPAVQVHLAPTSPKLRRVLPFFTPKSAGELIFTSSPPPPKKATTGGTSILHLSVALAGVKADGSGTYDERLAVVYTDGTELEVDLGPLANANDVLLRIQRHAKTLQSKDQALAV